jgi:hypothetical protein
MSREEFIDELDELIEAGRDGGLADEDMIVLLERATKALREGLAVAGARASSYVVGSCG